MLCKLLIYKDKLRITLEWIHSQASRRRDWSQSRPINGRKLYRVQSSRNQQQERNRAARIDRVAEQSRKRCRRKDTDTAQGRKVRQAARNVLHCEALKRNRKEPAANQQSRTGCETISEAQRGTREGLRGARHSTSRAVRARARAGARGTHGGSGRASGRKVSRMSAPNLGAHRTPTRPSRQHATYSGFAEF